MRLAVSISISVAPRSCADILTKTLGTHMILVSRSLRNIASRVGVYTITYKPYGMEISQLGTSYRFSEPVPPLISSAYSTNLESRPTKTLLIPLDWIPSFFDNIAVLLSAAIGLFLAVLLLAAYWLNESLEARNDRGAATAGPAVRIDDGARNILEYASASASEGTLRPSRIHFRPLSRRVFARGAIPFALFAIPALLSIAKYCGPHYTVIHFINQRTGATVTQGDIPPDLGSSASCKFTPAGDIEICWYHDMPMLAVTFDGYESYNFDPNKMPSRAISQLVPKPAATKPQATTER